MMKPPVVSPRWLHQLVDYEQNVQLVSRHYSGVMGCGNLGFPEFANLEPIGGKLADYRVYTPQDAPERTCVPRNGVSG